MKTISKIAAHLLAAGLFVALLVFNVQIGTPTAHAKNVTVPQAKADITITCGSRDAKCVTVKGKNFTLTVTGGVKSISSNATLSEN